MKLYLLREDQIYGPYSKEELSRFLQDGNASIDDKASLEGGNEWLPLSNFISPPGKSTGSNQNQNVTKQANKTHVSDRELARALLVSPIGGIKTGISTFILVCLFRFILWDFDYQIQFYVLSAILIIGNVIIICLWQKEAIPKRDIQKRLRLQLTEGFNSLTDVLSYLGAFSKDHGKDLCEDAKVSLDFIGYGKGFVLQKFGDLLIDDEIELERAKVSSSILLIEKAIEKLGRAYALSTAITFFGGIFWTTVAYEYLILKN